MDLFESSKAQDKLTDDDVSIKSSIYSTLGRRSCKSIKIGDLSSQSVINNIGIDGSRDIQIGNNINYQGPVTVQVQSLNLGGNAKCKCAFY